MLAYAAVKRKNIGLGDGQGKKGGLIAVFEADFVHPLWNFAHNHFIPVNTLDWMNLAKRYKRYFNLQGAVGIDTL
jgi:hypothetical protein